MRSAPLLPLLLLVCCKPLHRPTGGVTEAVGDARIAVDQVLDGFHQAAARADGRRYFGFMAKGAVFLGTDAKERWDRTAFQAYAEPYFSAGHGWSYEPLERHVFVDGDLAWFDERLWNETYGETRGSGVLLRTGRSWRIVQYNLAFPVPNEVAPEVVRLIRERPAAPGSEGG